MKHFFEIGKTYYTRSINPSDCVRGLTIKSRTAKTVTLENGERYWVSTSKRSSKYPERYEYIHPRGQSMWMILPAA